VANAFQLLTADVELLLIGSAINQTNFSFHFVIPVQAAVSQLKNKRSKIFGHSGLDPESRIFSSSYAPGCRIRSGMT